MSMVCDNVRVRRRGGVARPFDRGQPGRFLLAMPAGLLLAIGMQVLLTTPTAADPTDPDYWTHERFAEAAKRIDQAIPNIPLTEQGAAWTREGAFQTWAYGNAGSYREIDTPEKAAARAQELKDAGFRATLVRGAHYRQGRDAERMAEIHRNARLAVEACHAVGLKVIEQHDWTVTWAEGYETLFANPDWLQIDVRYHLPERRYCLNNPGFIENSIEFLVEFQKATGVDAHMIDEVTFLHEGTCGCEHCRAEFTRLTGYELPRFSGSPVLLNEAHPLWRLWVRWRQQSAAQYLARITEGVREINPDFVLVGYSTAFEHYVANTSANDMFSRGGVLQWPGMEGTNTVYPGYDFLITALSLRRAAADVWGKYAFSQFPATSDEETQFGVLVGLVSGVLPWGSEASDLLTWEHWPTANRPHQAVADVGLIFALATRETGPLAANLQMQEYYGWAHALLASGILHRPVLDRGPNGVDLSGLRTVVVPASEALPIDLNRQLLQFAEAGGTVILVGASGMLDDYGLPRERSELAEAVKIREVAFRGDIEAGAGWRLEDDEPGVLVPAAGGLPVFGSETDQLVLERNIPYDVTYDLAPEDEVLARFANGSIAAVASPVGQGRVIHLAFTPGRATFQPKLRLGMEIQAWIDSEARQIISDLLGRAEAVSGRFSRIEGTGVIGSVFREDDQMVVHLLNVGGHPQWDEASGRAGTTLTRADAVPSYPETGPITVTLTATNIQSARWLDPDSHDEIELELNQDSQNTVLQVPAGALHRYGLIDLTLEP